MGPVAPAVPVAPVAPMGPVAPAAPAVPVAPVAPVAPVVPVGPVGPIQHLGQLQQGLGTQHLMGWQPQSLETQASASRRDAAKSEASIDLRGNIFILITSGLSYAGRAGMDTTRAGAVRSGSCLLRTGSGHSSCSGPDPSFCSGLGPDPYGSWRCCGCCFGSRS